MTQSRQLPVAAVLFDWGGTLTPWASIDLVEQWRHYADVYDPAQAEELAAALRAGEDHAWAQARDHHRSATLDEIFLGAGVDIASDHHQDALAAYLSYWEPHTQLVPDALDTITDLRRRGYKIGVLSNTLWPASFHREVFRRDGLLDHIDAAVYSSEIPWTKPHPKAFQTLLDQLGVTDPERAVFVGDRLFDDIHGAKAVGMHAIYVPHSQIPTNQLGHTNGEPDAVIDRLADLLDILDGLPVA